MAVPYYILALSSSLLHTTSRTPIQACQPIDKRRHKCAVATVFVCLLFLVPRVSQLALLWRGLGGKATGKCGFAAFSCVKRSFDFAQDRLCAGSVKRSGQGPRRTDHGAQVRIYVVSRIRMDARTAGGRREAGGGRLEEERTTGHGPRDTGHGIRIYASTLLRFYAAGGRSGRIHFLYSADLAYG